MGSFDMRTIIFIFFLTYIVSTAVIFILWVQYHDRYKGTTQLFINFALQTIGMLLIVLRGSIPEWISIDIANTFVIAGILFGYMGLESFTGKKSNQIPNMILVVIFAVIHTYYTYYKPDLSARSLNISVISLILFFQSAWLMLYRVPKKSIPLTHSVGLIFVAFCIVSLLNILKIFYGGREMPVDYFDAVGFDTVIIIVYHMLVVFLTYSLVLMYSKNLLLTIITEEEKSLLSDIEKNEEQKKYNELIRHERNLLRTLIDNLPDPVSIKDSESRFILNNSAHLELLGADSQEEVIGKTIFDFWPEDQAAEADAADKSVLKKGQMILDKVESSINRETGFPYWHLASRIPIMNSDGKPFQLITIRHDITERKRAEDLLKDTAEFTRSLLKTIPFGMDIVDESGNILFHSENFRGLFGQAAIGKKCWEVYRDDKEQCHDCPLKNGIVIGKTEIYESHGVLGDKIFDIYHTGINYQGKKAMLEIFHDITNHKNTEEELIRSKEHAEESNRLKSAFLHNISHEIRTPMNAIIGFVTLLADPEISEEDHRSYLEIITQSSDHLLSIVTDIIEVSNIEAGKLKLNMKKVIIRPVLENLNMHFKSVAAAKGIDLIFENPESDNEEFIYTDSTKFIQVMSNLLANACKFTEEGSIRMGYVRNSDQMEFFVSDTGIGIPEDQQAKIFERFYQVDSRETRQHEGTGLGLSLSKAYIEFLGGKLWVKSEHGKGSTFFVSLPA